MWPISQRQYNHLCRVAAEQRKRERDYTAMLELVVQEVHPAHFDQLPPAPSELEVKASLLGIRVWV
jgi:hypothetical protein